MTARKKAVPKRAVKIKAPGARINAVELTTNADSIVCTATTMFRVRNQRTQELFFAVSRSAALTFLVSGAGKDWIDVTIAKLDVPLEGIW